jgi:hypothetical protein
MRAWNLGSQWGSDSDKHAVRQTNIQIFGPRKHKFLVSCDCTVELKQRGRFLLWPGYFSILKSYKFCLHIHGVNLTQAFTSGCGYKIYRSEFKFPQSTSLVQQISAQNLPRIMCAHSCWSGRGVLQLTLNQELYNTFYISPTLEHIHRHFVPQIYTLFL